MTGMLRFGPSGAPRGAVLLHGRGGSGAEMLALPAQAGVQGLSLIAPEAAGNSWWPTSFLAPMDVLSPFLDAALAMVDRAMEELVANGTPRNGISIAGFSQGACLALEYCARREGLGSVVALSGGLLGTSDASGGAEAALYGHSPKRFDYHTRLEGLPVWISCHARDPHIPIARVRQSAEVLTALGAKPEVHVIPGAGHGTDQASLQALARYLA